MLDRVLNPVLVTVEIDDDDDDEEDGTLEIEAKPSKVRDAIFDVIFVDVASHLLPMVLSSDKKFEIQPPNSKKQKHTRHNALIKRNKQLHTT